MSKKQPLVSVIVVTKNVEKYLSRCLQSIKDQTYQNIEIIVVDNFSEDLSYDIAGEYTSKVYQYGTERSNQFNYGFSKSRGLLIYHVGADFVLERDVVEKCMKKIGEGYAALAVHNRSSGDSIWAKVRYLERETYQHDRNIVAVRFMKRDVFKNVGMYDESLVAAEDYDLHNRIVEAGYRWIHVDAVEYHIGEPRSILEVWKKNFYYGRTIRRYIAKHPERAKKQFVLFRPGFLKIFKDNRSKPGLLISFLFYLFVKNLAGAVGMLAGPPKQLRTK